MSTRYRAKLMEDTRTYDIRMIFSEKLQSADMTSRGFRMIGRFNFVKTAE